MAATHSHQRQPGEGGRPVGNSSSRAASRPRRTATIQEANQARAAAPGAAPGRVMRP